jgi:hypothetical protein
VCRWRAFSFVPCGSLWGIEANYPGADNSYLKEVANELLPEAVAVARETLARLAVHAQALEGA